MGWITVIWLMIAAASATLALIHAYAWTRLPRAQQHGAFVMCAAGVAMIALVELAMMRSSTPEAYGHFLWLNHFPLWLATLGSVLFVRIHMNAGRGWLAWSAVGLRTLAMVLNAVSSPNLNFREIRAVEPIQALGETVYFALGTPSPLIIVALLSGLVQALFIIDATVEVWRRGDRRLALTVGGLLTFFVLLAVLGSMLRVVGLVHFPAVITLSCVPIIMALAFEVGRELVQSLEMSAALKARHAELTASETSLQLAAEAAHVALWSVDRNSGEMWMTARAAAMFGYAPDGQLVDNDVLARIHPDDRQRVKAALSSLRGGQQALVEYRVRLPDGGERWYSSLAGLQRAEPDAPETVTGVTIDITARRLAELESERHRTELERLERVNRASEFSAAMAHELSQPLAIIMSNAEAAQRMLRRPAPDLGELRAVFKDIVTADERATAVLARLRELPGQHELRSVRFAVKGLVEEVLVMMQGDLAKHRVVLTTEFAHELAAVDGDRMLIGQVLFNLIRNACEAMSADEAGERSLTIATALAEGTIEVRVSDTGIGLPDDPDQVFEAFFTTKADGLGVGLAICRSIVQAHGGSLSAQSNDQRGARFLLRLPRSRADAAVTGVAA